MRKLFFALIVAPWACLGLSGCANCEDSTDATCTFQTNMQEPSTADTATNTDASIARDVLFFLGRKPMPELIQYSEDELRNSAISDLEPRCSTPVSSIQSLSTDEVAYALLVESILSRDPAGHAGLTAMSIEDQRNTLIVANNQRLRSKSIAQLQALNSYQNSRLAYDWLLPALASRLIDSVGNLALGTATFQASALNSISSPPSTVGMDVACIRFHDGLNSWIAVFHKQQPHEDLFDLYVAVGSSPNSLEVTAVLGTNASMGQFYFLGDGVLLLYEQNNIGGPSVAASYYENLKDFLSGQSDPKTFVSQQTLGGSAEGTPSLTVIDETADELTIGMHCYISKGGTKVDQQAGYVFRFRQVRSVALSSCINQCEVHVVVHPLFFQPVVSRPGAASTFVSRTFTRNYAFPAFSRRPWYRFCINNTQMTTPTSTAALACLTLPSTSRTRTICTIDIAVRFVAGAVVIKLRNRIP